MALTLPQRQVLFGRAARSTAPVFSIVSLGTATDTIGDAILTTSVDIPAGALVIAIVSAPAANCQVVDDTDSFSYTAVDTSPSQGGIFYRYNAPFLAAGNTIEAGVTAGSANVAFSLFYVTGAFTASDPLDTGTSTTFVTTTTPSQSITTTFAKTLLVGSLSVNLTTATTYTQAAGYTTPPNKIGNTSVFVAGGTKSIVAAGSQTYAPTIGTSAPSNGNKITLAAFKLL